MAITRETMQALEAMRVSVKYLVEDRVTDIIAVWVAALAEIREELLRLGRAGTPQVHLLRQSRRIVAETILQIMEQSGIRLTEAARRMVENATEQQVGLILSQLPPGLHSTILRPTRAALTAIINRTVEQITARNRLLGARAIQSMHRNLRLGIAGGMNPREVADRMIRNLGKEFTGGITRALTIARTEMLDAHRAASLATRQSNRDALAGWVWIATLDTRTCPSCIHQHGRLHDIDEPGPIDHHNGRCDSLPRTKTWEDLGIIGAKEPEGVDIETGDAWFERLGEDKQRELLGPGRYEAWQNGDYPPSAWSEKRKTDGWRDALHVSNVPH